MKNIEKSKFNKYRLLLSLIFIVVLSLSLLGCSSNKNEKVSNIEVKYEKGSTIKLSNLKKGVVYTNDMTVTNNSNKDITYSISWKEVSNNFKVQNKLLYDLNTTDVDAGFLSKSQVPVADSTMFDKLVIKKGKTHTYKLTVYFEGDPNQEQDSTFTGTIDIKEIN